MSVAKKAVKESKEVAKLARDAAMNELIERLNPTIKAIVDAQMRAGTLGADAGNLSEGVNRMRQAADYDGITDFEEGVDMKKDKKDQAESVSALFPSIVEMSGEMDEAADEDMDEATEAPVTEGEDEEMDEDLEISESELEEMYAEALQLEVDVKKGFSDMEKPHELGGGVKNDNTKEPASLADLKAGEHTWEGEEPPHKKDWIPEGKVRAAIEQGLRENVVLFRQNKKLREMVQKMHKQLRESNLLNSKILHVNKFMTAHKLTSEQKKTVIESIDKGSTIKEVKSIFGILENSFKAAGAVSESAVRRPRGDSQKRRTSGAPDPKVLRESADREEGGGVTRWQQLAGLKKIVG